MKITLLTAASENYWPLLQYTATNKLEYCLKHGVEFHMEKHNNTNELKHERQEMMWNTLTNTDWLWFMGADTLIMNQTIDVRQFIHTKYDLIISEDINGLNNDVFFLKNNINGREFLYHVLRNNEKCENDQESMKKAIKDLKELKVHIVPQKQFNSYLYTEYNYPDDKGGSYTPGDFILHLPGLPNTRRMEIVKEYLKLVDK